MKRAEGPILALITVALLIGTVLLVLLAIAEKPVGEGGLAILMGAVMLVGSRTFSDAYGRASGGLWRRPVRIALLVIGASAIGGGVAILLAA